MGVDVPDETVSRHLDGLPLDHHLLHAAGVVHLVSSDAELARPEERNQRKCALGEFFVTLTQPWMAAKEEWVVCVC